MSENQESKEDMNLNAVYVEGVMAFHNLRDKTKESISKLQEADVTKSFQDFQDRAQRTLDVVKGKFAAPTPPASQHELLNKYSHIFRRKNRWELILLSGAVCGIEFCYSAETAFVTPTLLTLGLDVKFMTMIWCLSPILGFLVTPLLGSMSDSCNSRFGRRRPFIVLLSVGILLGLILVPNGQAIGLALGDVPYEPEYNITYANMETMGNASKSFYEHFESTYPIQALQKSMRSMNSNPHSVLTEGNTPTVNRVQPWGVLFTVVGTILLDFCSDACQSPARTYLLDVTVQEDHGIGLSTFTMMAGFGGSIGYLMGAINWEATGLGVVLGGHVRAVFTIVTVLFVVCMLATITSFAEIPLPLLETTNSLTDCDEKAYTVKYRSLEEEPQETAAILGSEQPTYGATSHPNPSPVPDSKVSIVCNKETEITTSDLTVTGGHPTFKQYLISIFHMPKSLAILCLTNLFCWMSLVCYSLYFTDFVGEYIYGGDPLAAAGSPKYRLYEDGVRFGCWGMAAYSMSCAIYSYCIGGLIEKIGAKQVYIGSQVMFALGMFGMALLRHKVGVIVLSITSGIMYGTIFTIPYLLVAHYHCMQTFDNKTESGTKDVRGIGTDVAIVSSMVFIAQFLLSLTMGSIVAAVASSAAIVWSAGILALCGAISATQVLYLDL